MDVEGTDSKERGEKHIVWPELRFCFVRREIAHLACFRTEFRKKKRPIFSGHLRSADN